MKTTALIFSFACCAAVLLAQDATVPVRVMVTTHEDGTRTETKVDAANHVAEAVTYDANHKMRQKLVYKLDESGIWRESTAYGADGAFLFRATYKRDGTGRVLEESQFTQDNQLFRRLVYRYDDKGHMSGIDAFDGSGTPLVATQPAQPAKAKRVRGR